jgi:hypothetical protein
MFVAPEPGDVVRVPRVSVAVPLYQKAATVRRCLASIAAQTLGDFEAIVVDDGSTDGCGSAVAELADSRFRLLRQANAGPGAARNRGIEEARSAYVAFLDADDSWDAGYLAHMVARLDANAVAVAVACSYRTARGSRVPRWRRAGLTNGPARVEPHTPPADVVTLAAFLSPCTTIVRRDAVRSAGGFYEHGCRYGEDNFLAFKLVWSGTIEVVLADLVTVDDGASALSVRRPTRPLEPVFAGAAELRAHAPVALHALVDDVLALHAGKTACIMTYWGRHREAAELIDGFTRRRHLRYGWVLLGRVSASPAGALAAAAVRQFSLAR